MAGMRTVLAIVSLGAALICGWLTSMYYLLQHDGWMPRAAITALLLLHCALTVFAAEGVLTGVWVERLQIAGAAGAMVFAAVAVHSVANAVHFEGFWLPVAVALFVQAGLTIAVVVRQSPLSKA